MYSFVKNVMVYKNGGQMERLEQYCKDNGWKIEIGYRIDQRGNSQTVLCTTKDNLTADVPFEVITRIDTLISMMEGLQRDNKRQMAFAFV